ncbi:DUF1634 domain-containing protein [Mucilaginibacter antarcticus]|uniref:DUF1634 domain-containing protein n=1 Tax=Mucilaginibacter antarcticus TaxID=1855725 RepID=A0ABW5XRN5_9SPHI
MKTKDVIIQDIIGWVLRIGVLLSITIVVFGGAIYLYRNGQKLADYHTFKGIPDFVRPGAIVKGVFSLRGRAIIQAGIVLLIATPVMRVVFSAIGFILEKDYLYTFITIIVLAVIFFSLLTGQAG